MTKQRLKILSKSEINELYDIPHFNANEREKYFSLDKKEYTAMSKCGSLASKVHFALQLGYFKAASQFFNCAFDMVTNNAKILNSLFEKLQKDGSKELIEYLKYISPVAWININLYGFYTFEKDSVQIDLAKLAESINMLKTV